MYYGTLFARMIILARQGKITVSGKQYLNMTADLIDIHRENYGSWGDGLHKEILCVGCGKLHTISSGVRFRPFLLDCLECNPAGIPRYNDTLYNLISMCERLNFAERCHAVGIVLKMGCFDAPDKFFVRRTPVTSLTGGNEHHAINNGLARGVKKKLDSTVPSASFAKLKERIKNVEKTDLDFL